MQQKKDSARNAYKYRAAGPQFSYPTSATKLGLINARCANRVCQPCQHSLLRLAPLAAQCSPTLTRPRARGDAIAQPLACADPITNQHATIRSQAANLHWFAPGRDKTPHTYHRQKVSPLFLTHHGFSSASFNSHCLGITPCLGNHTQDTCNSHHTVPHTPAVESFPITEKS